MAAQEDLAAEAAAADRAAELPVWFYEQQIESLGKLIKSEQDQREALVRWMDQIDGNVTKWTAERQQLQADLIWARRRGGAE